MCQSVLFISVEVPHKGKVMLNNFILSHQHVSNGEFNSCIFIYFLTLKYFRMTTCTLDVIFMKNNGLC